MEVADASREVVGFLVRLADRISGHFPHHAAALRGEIIGERLTNERWNRIAAILASFSSVPGATLCAEEHASRALALRAVAVTQKMAQARLSYREDPEYLGELATWMAREIDRDMQPKPGG